MRNAIRNYLKQTTKNLKDTDQSCFSAHWIAEEFQLNRSTVSNYLNQFFKAGEVIKIKTYPVMFLHRLAFSEAFFEAKKSEYHSLKELLEEHSIESSLEQVIGAKGSLKEQVEQIKTAVLYPGNGLPIMLIGASGSGKTFLTSQIYEYAKEEGAIRQQAPFISYNCAQYFNNPELLSSVLFGYTKGAFTGAEEEKQGLLQQADGGVLFLDEVHRLSEEGQEKLFTFMDNGQYSPIGDNSKVYSANVRLIFATTENIHSAFLPTFLRRLPVIVSLPNFQQRPYSEKLRLIDNFFIIESNILQKNVHVSQKVLNYLLNTDFEGNVGKIKNIIKYACGSAYARQKNTGKIEVRLPDIPLDHSNKVKETTVQKWRNVPDRSYYPEMELQEELETVEKVRLMNFFEGLLADFIKVERKKLSPNHFIEFAEKNVTLLMDEFIFHHSYEKNETHFSFLTYNIRNTLKFMHENYGVEQDGNTVLSIANYLYIKENQDILGEHSEWTTIQPRLLQFLNEYIEDAFWLSKQLLSHLTNEIDSPIKEEDLLFISFYLYSLKLSTITSEIKCIVLAHGYSTASSLANVANRMLQKNIFQAYDMPLDITLVEVENKILRYMENYRTDAGLILLVDMGSLNQLAKRLVNKIRGPLLIIDSVNTSMVLEIGEQVASGKAINDIHNEFSVEKRMAKQLVFPKEHKKKAIITCCYTGMGSAVQIQEILQKSLGDAGRTLTILPYDYHKLKENKTQELPFQMYDVLAIVGTEDPQIDQISYIGLDQLVDGEQIETFAELLKQHFKVEEKQLKEELIFNFSIKKIVENLTILDPDKVLRFVQEAVSLIERYLALQFTNNQRFLLYLHTSCMIERILRKEKVDPQDDLMEYMEREQRNIEKLRLALKEIEKEYTIKVPDLELRLLNDIVFG